MSNSKQGLLDALKKFRADHGRMPIRQDWKDGKIEPCYMTFYREFGTVKKMAKELDLYERGETVFEDKPGNGYSEAGNGKDGNGKAGVGEEPFHAKHAKTRTPFRCGFCGGHIQTSFEWSTAKSYIIYRLVKLIGEHKEEKVGQFDSGDYEAAVFDSLARIFGAANQAVENALRKAGYYEAYLKEITPETIEAEKIISGRDT